MNRRLGLAVLLAIAICSSPSRADDVDDAILAFVNEDGFERQDLGTVEAELARAFPDAAGPDPDGAASAIEKALLLIRGIEPPLDRIRYMVRYGQMMQNEIPVSFINVERYNLGPSVRLATIEAYGEENTAGPEEFGVGPHVEWRIVAKPGAGQAAALVDAARREIGDEEAGETDCGGRGCLSYDSTMDDLHEWQEVEGGVDIATAYPPVLEDGASDPAFAAAELFVLAGLTGQDGGRPVWRGPEQPEAARFGEPFLFVAIDFNLGQDVGVDAMLGQTLLNDDAIEELWYLRLQFPDSSSLGQRSWMRAVVERER